MRITLTAGRAHIKHTEGGDFRQATYRAVRQGLRQARCRILEPYYDFRLEVPQESVGRAMADLERMQASFEGPEQEGERMILTGYGPVALMGDYQRELVSYTGGRGRIMCTLRGYLPCHNEEQVLEQAGYDPEADLDNPVGSVFCAHGAGFVVPWYEVKDYMQVETPSWVAERLKRKAGDGDEGTAAGAAGNDGMAGMGGRSENGFPGRGGAAGSRTGGPGGSWGRDFGAEEKELEAIFTRTYGESRRRLPGEQGPRLVTCKSGTGREASPEKPIPSQGKPGYMKRQPETAEEYLLVDGYNILHAWEDLRELMQVTLDGARHRLLDILCNYQAYRRCRLIVVFDAYKVAGGIGSAQDYHNIHVVYTKEAETADQYIEKFAHQMGRKNKVTVATSDGVEQLIIRGQGCMLMSAADLREDVERVGRQIEEERGNLPKPGKNYLFQDVDQDLKEYLEQLRLGKESGSEP